MKSLVALENAAVNNLPPAGKFGRMLALSTDGTLNFDTGTEWLKLPMQSRVLTNYALASNGGVIAVTSSGAANYPGSAVIDGDRSTKGDSNNYSIWRSAAAPTASAPQEATITFPAARAITKATLVSLYNAANYTAQPTGSESISSFGITDYTVKCKNASTGLFETVATVTANSQVIRESTFAPFTTTDVRFSITAANYPLVHVVELEARG